MTEYMQVITTVDSTEEAERLGGLCKTLLEEVKPDCGAE
jgi:hypothetical protein